MDSNAFRKGFFNGWDAGKVLEWEPIHELEEKADTMRRAGEYESCGYWCGYKESQIAHAGSNDQYSQSDENGMLTSYDYRIKRR